MFDHDKNIPIGFDLPWVLALLFLIGFYTKTLSFDDKSDSSEKPPENITQLEVNLSSKESGSFMVFSNGELSKQGFFDSAEELNNRAGVIDRGFIDTDNLNLTLGELKAFKEKVGKNIKIYHVR